MTLRLNLNGRSTPLFECSRQIQGLDRDGWGFRAVAESVGLIRFTAGERRHPMVLESSPQQGRLSGQLISQVEIHLNTPAVPKSSLLLRY